MYFLLDIKLNVVEKILKKIYHFFIFNFFSSTLVALLFLYLNVWEFYLDCEGFANQTDSLTVTEFLRMYESSGKSFHVMNIRQCSYSERSPLLLGLFSSSSSYHFIKALKSTIK